MVEVFDKAALIGRVHGVVRQIDALPGEGLHQMHYVAGSDEGLAVVRSILTGAGLEVELFPHGELVVHGRWAEEKPKLEEELWLVLEAVATAAGCELTGRETEMSLSEEERAELFAMLQQDVAKGRGVWPGDATHFADIFKT